MWENKRRKTIVWNILIFIVLVAAAAGLLYAFNKVRKQIAAEDAQLAQANSNQRQEQNDARQENLAAIQQAYELDLQTVADYMPGIVCWGDSLTAGSSGNVSYPDTLQKYVNTYLCNIYNFRSTLDGAGDTAVLKWDDYKFSIPVVNMGAGQENSATILGRSGVVPYVVDEAFTIPAGTDTVRITLSSKDGRAVTPLTTGSAGINPVTINGVPGTLTVVANTNAWMQYYYEFRRLEPGDRVDVKKGTEIVTAVSDQYQNYIHIVWLGTYDGYRTAEELVSDVRKLLSRQIGNSDRYLVLGPCTVNGTWETASSYTLDTIDTAMLQAFGDHYINVRKYLIEDGLTDAGLTATSMDTDYQRRSLVPASLRSTAAGADLNGTAYTLIGRLVYQRMDRLGFFAEIRTELGLDKTAENLLKQDPDYFNKFLK